MKNHHIQRRVLLVGVFLLLLSVKSFGFTVPGRHNLWTPTKKSHGRQTSNLCMSDPLAIFGGAAKARSMTGRIPWHKFRISGDQAREIASSVKAEANAADIALLAFFSLFSTPFFRFIYNRFLKSTVGKKDYEESFTYEVAENVRKASKIISFLYLIDFLEIALEIMGLDSKKFSFSHTVSQLVFGSWVFKRVRYYARRFIERRFLSAGEKTVREKGKFRLWEKLLDGFLSVVVFLFWLDILHIPMGKGLSSIFALGGAGTLVITLACQDIAKKLLSGLALSTSEAFFEGESIRLGDGTSGNVVKLGWLSTEIRASNEQVTVIPNSNLLDMKVINLSRIERCQVTQTLRFYYEDIKKIPKVTRDIEAEIEKSCPNLIKDGSRPFRARWQDYQNDHLEATVVCHFDCKPSGSVYWDTRQNMLEAINRAVEKNSVKFAIPVSKST